MSGPFAVPGDRVRVEFEGVVIGTRSFAAGGQCGHPWNVEVKLSDGTRAFARDVHVTVIEPDYETGAAYIDARGDVYQFYPANFCDDQPEPVWNAFGQMAEVPFGVPRRPLRRLVPEH